MIKSHLILAQHFWKNHLRIGDTAIDATCGNGHDSLFLAKTILSSDSGELICLDIQELAIINTQKLLEENLPKELLNRIDFIKQSHATFPPTKPPSLIVYNLGYLPGSDKYITTRVESTLTSLKNALKILKKEGLISIMLYPGHPEGKLEKTALIQFTRDLSPNFYVTHREVKNRSKAPSLLLVRKLK